MNALNALDQPSGAAAVTMSAFVAHDSGIVECKPRRLQMALEADMCRECWWTHSGMTCKDIANMSKYDDTCIQAPLSLVEMQEHAP